MRVAIVTGIFPPDIGGPATHAANLATRFRSKGIDVVVFSLWDGRRVDRRSHQVRFPRRWPWWARHLGMAANLFAARCRYDVIYATGMHPAAVAGALAARRPVVLKVVADPAWERGRRKGLAGSDFEVFQQEIGLGLRMKGMVSVRNWTVRRAAAVIAPSRHLAGAVQQWGNFPPVKVIPNGIDLADVPKPAKDTGSNRPLKAVFVGRLIADKRVEMIVEALGIAKEVRLEIIGEGPRRAEVEKLIGRLGLKDRVEMTGSLTRDEVLSKMAEADVLVLASRHEGLPHVCIEALACGTPVIAPPVGGIPEVVVDAATGLLLTPINPKALASTLVRLRQNPKLLKSMSRQCLQEAQKWTFAEAGDKIEALLRQVSATRPAVVFLGKGGFSDSSENLTERLKIVARHMKITLIGSDGPAQLGDEIQTVRTPRLPSSAATSVLFYCAGPALAIAHSLSPHSAIICQSPYEAVVLLGICRALPKRIRPAVVVEVHGDWTSATRLYGSALRKATGPVADRLAAWAVTRADRVRVVGDHTEQLVRSAGYRGPVDRYVAHIDFVALLKNKPADFPAKPQLAFVGSLQPSKGPDILIEAFALVLGTCPDATLVIAGEGPMRSVLERRVNELAMGSSVSFAGRLPRDKVVHLLDGSWALVVPSRTEGFGRVILEAFARARPVVAVNVGGIPESVIDGVNGLIAEPGSHEALASRMTKILADRDKSARMGQQGRRLVEELDPNTQFEAGIARLALWLCGR